MSPRRPILSGFFLFAALLGISFPLPVSREIVGDPPCDLSRFEKLPAIWLNGEFHRAPVDRKFLRKVGKAAIDGTVALALEGTRFDDAFLRNRNSAWPQKFGITEPILDDVRLFGLEDIWDDAINFLDQMGDSAAEARHRGKWQSEQWGWAFIQYALFSTVIRQTWSALPRPLGDEATEAIAKDLDHIFQRKLVGDWMEGKVSDAWKNPAALGNLLLTVGQALQTAAEIHYRNLGKRIPLESFLPKLKTNLSKAGFLERRQLASEPTALEAKVAMLRDFTLRWRNQTFAANIGRVYCQVAAEGNPLVVIVGSAHLPGVHDLLSEQTRGRVHLFITEHGRPLSQKQLRHIKRNWDDSL